MTMMSAQQAFCSVPQTLLSCVFLFSKKQQTENCVSNTIGEIMLFMFVANLLNKATFANNKHDVARIVNVARIAKRRESSMNCRQSDHPVLWSLHYDERTAPHRHHHQLSHQSTCDQEKVFAWHLSRI